MIRKLSVALAALAALCTLALCLSAQEKEKKEKPWTEWSKKDVEKMLDDSPWAQTQTVTDTSEMFYSPTATPDQRTGASRNSASRDAQGATNTATDVKYRIRFFSARPIRQALARQIMLNNSTNKEMEQRLKSFADLQSNESIIVTVTFESNDARFGNEAMQAFNSATTASLKNSTYLERADGKRLFLAEYVPPGKDGFGARFIFPRNLGETPFITAEAGDVRFASQVKKIELNMRFKTSRMSYGGGLEY